MLSSRQTFALPPRLRGTPGLAAAQRGMFAACLLGLATVVAVSAASPARADSVRSQELWVLNAIHAPVVWPATEGRGVTVAVIDSGVNGSVSDLAGSVVSGPNLSGVRTPPANPHWGVHGTWMASLIAGHGHAGGSSGIVGVAPQSRILSIRVVSDPGDPGFRHYQHESEAAVQGALAQAIQYAIRHRAGVISMSLGYGAPSRQVRSAIQHALNAGVVVVASSGNSGEAPSARRHGHAPYSFPADYPGVLGVAAVDQAGAPAGFSSDNLSVEVAAPGVKVPAQGRDGQYWLVSGTSPACALTAGVAALIRSRYPRLQPALAMQAITATAQNRPPGGYDDRVGFGTVDAAAALAYAGRLAHDRGAGRGVPPAAHFGGGPQAVPAPPVAPRGRQPLIVFGLAALVCVIVVAVSAARLLARRRSPVPAAGAWPGAGSGAVMGPAGPGAAPWGPHPGPGAWQAPPRGTPPDGGTPSGGGWVPGGAAPPGGSAPPGGWAPWDEAPPGGDQGAPPPDPPPGPWREPW